jgi:hypothetical protein
MSAMTQRANDRLLEYAFVEGEITPKSRAAGTTAPSDRGKVPVQEQEERRDVFGEILKQVDILRGMGTAETITLRRNQIREDFCAPSCPKVYRVALPTKPAIISIEVERFLGEDRQDGTLSCYASTETVKPCAQNHQLFGETGVEYIHAFTEVTEGNDGRYVDRRKVAPDKKYLYISIDFSTRGQECRYRIRCVLNKMTIVLTEEELRERPACVPTQQWEKRIIDIKNDPVKKADFDVKMKEHKEAMEQKLGQSDFVKRNRKIQAPVVKYTQQCQMALDNCQHQTQVQKRKEELLNDLSQRRVEWLHRAEARRAREAAEKERQRVEMEHHQRREEWFIYLMLNMGTIAMANRYAQKQEEIKLWYLQNFASKVIQKCWLVKWAPWRRRQMYIHILKVRAGLLSFIRTARTACHVGSCHVVINFLQNTTASSENPRACISRFLKCVRKIQHHWHRLVMVKAARLEVYTFQWRKIEQAILAPKPPQPEADSEKKSESKPLKAVANGGKGRRKTLFRNREALPDIIVEKLLKKLIHEQMQQWVQAFRDYKFERKSLQSTKLLETQLAEVASKGQSGANIQLDVPRSTSFYCSLDAIQDVVYKAHEDFKAGKLAHLMEEPEEPVSASSTKMNGTLGTPKTPGKLAPLMSRKTAPK